MTRLFAASLNLVAAVLGNSIPSHHSQASSLVSGRDLHGSSDQAARAIYFMTNPFLSPNSVVAVRVASDGSLSKPVFTATGGNGGGYGKNVITGVPGGPDAFGSQGSVRVADNLLFVTNAGSNTLSMFEISSEDPTHLTLIGKPNYTGGEGPVSVAVSRKLGIVCVGHFAGTGGVSCANFHSRHGLGHFDAIRPFNLAQTNPPIGPLNGLGQLLFTADNNELIAVVKGNGSAARPNYFETYSVNFQKREVSRRGKTVDTGKTGIAFGVALIPKTDRLLVSTVNYGATIVSTNNLGVPITTTNITNQKATCWATVSDFTGTGFVDDVIVSQLTEIDLSTGAILKTLPVNNGGQGLLDMEAVGTKIYALSPGNGTLSAEVVVFDISGGPGSVKQVQRFKVKKANQDAEGMGVFPNPGESTG